MRFTRREVREATGWSDTQLKVHFARLVELEYLIVRRAVDGRHASLFVYELAYGGEGEDGSPFLMGLIDAEALAAESGAAGRAAFEQGANERSYDEDRSACEQDRPGVGRPSVVPRSQGGPAQEHPDVPFTDNGLATSADSVAPDENPGTRPASVVTIQAKAN